MKEKLLNNLGIKILSICLAAFLWVVIVNVDDPVKTRTFTNVPVQVLNENTLISKNKAFDIISGEMVDFSVSGKRSQLEKLQRSDFVATADLAQLTTPFDTVKIDVECTKNQDIQIIMGKISTMKISLEDVVKQRFSIKVDSVGTCAPGYAVGKAEVSPVMLDISGAESQVEKIADVKVTVDINGASQDVTRTVVPKAYNRNGVEIPADKLTFSNREVTARISIQNTKKIPVSIITTGSVAKGYEFIGTAYEPQEIEVKGDNANLAAINELPITIDITGLKEDKEYTISIHEQLMQYGVSIVDSELENLVIKVTIKMLVEKQFDIRPEDIQVKNLKDGLSTEFLDVNKVYKVTLIGPEEQFEKIDVESLEPRIDFSGLDSGRHNVKLELTYPESVIQKTVVMVRVKLVEESHDKQTVTKKPDDGARGDKPSVKPSIEPSVQPIHSPNITPDVSEDSEDEEKKE